MDLDLPVLMNYGDVFGEKEVDRLPPYRSYYCLIDLVPDAIVPLGWIYSVGNGVGGVVGVH